jgi:threonine dehydrogenase-like Zn-dependent dehydrogenase
VVGPRQVEIRQVPIPATTPDSGLVEVELCGVCGADWPRYTGQRMGDTRTPVILGHEIVGRIAEIGSRLADLLQVRPGDFVMVEEPRPCGACAACAVEDYFGCPGEKYGSTTTDTFPSLWGGYAEHVYIDKRSIVHVLDPEVPMDAYSLAIPLANGLHWVGMVGQLRQGETLLVQGPGQHGLACVYAGRQLGAGRIVVVGRASDTLRLKMARTLGATDTIVLEDEDDLATRVREVTGGAMADVVVQIASSSSTAFSDSLASAGPRARVVTAGFAETYTTLQPDVIIQKQLTVTGVRGRPSEYTRKAIELIGGDPKTFQGMVTHTYGLAETEQALLTVGRERDADTALHINVRPRL